MSVEDAPIRWEEAGEGFPIVLIHGIPTSPRLWRHVIPQLSGARVMAFEMVGYGRSIPEGRGRDISVAAQADHLLRWLDALQVERAILAGHDLGAGVAQIAAVRRPELCAGLFITNGIGYDSWPVLGVKAMRAAGALVERMPNTAFKRVFSGFIRGGHDDSARAKEAVAEHWAPYAEADGAAAFIRQARALDVNDTLSVADRLPELRLPARVVWGAADMFQRIAYGERFARDLRAPLRRIEGGRHFTPEDHPDVVAEALNELVEEAAPGVHACSAPKHQKNDLFHRGMTIVPSLPEVMPDEAPSAVKAVYEDIQASLRTPFVNLVFRLIANEPEQLQALWRAIAPITRSRAFEDAARELRRLAEPAVEARLLPNERFEKMDEARGFTESIHYVLPKLLLATTLLDPEAGTDGGTEPAKSGWIPQGIPEDAVKLPMTDPEAPALRDLFEEIRSRHGHPKVASWWRGLGQDPELLREIWTRVRSDVGEAARAARRDDLVARAEALTQRLRQPDAAPPEPSDQAHAILAVFRRRVIPDLMLDVGQARMMLGAAGPSRFDI